MVLSCASYQFRPIWYQSLDTKQNLTFKKIRHNSCHQIIMKINSFYSFSIRYYSKDVYENFSLGDFFSQWRRTLGILAQETFSQIRRNVNAPNLDYYVLPRRCHFDSNYLAPFLCLFLTTRLMQLFTISWMLWHSKTKTIHPFQCPV